LSAVKQFGAVAGGDVDGNDLQEVVVEE